MNSKDNNNIFSEDFIQKISLQTLELISPEDLDDILFKLQNRINKNVFSYQSESNLLRIILSMYNKSQFLKDCLLYPHYIDILIAVASYSNYLTDIIVRNPEYFFLISQPQYLQGKISKAQINKEIHSIFHSLRTFNAKVNSLRLLKRRYILLIGVKDILGFSNLKQTTKELSVLAESICKNLFKLCYNEISKKYKLKKKHGSYCLISLGKLGGSELNYSSDVDLIIFSSSNQSVTSSKTFNNILTEIVQLFISQASSITDKGFLYRIDFRLRPDGRNSELCKTLDEMIDYYESRGENWERQMLIKNSFLAGEKNLYNKFSSAVSHFIYPESSKYSPAELGKSLKLINSEDFDEYDIKNSLGGIRSIEFSIQFLQLLFGGKENKIRSANTLSALLKLKKYNFLSVQETNILKNAYIFYRKIEHFLQLMNDRQTHSLPKDELLYKSLYVFMGFNSAEQFENNLAFHKNNVTKIYNSITFAKDNSGSSTNLQLAKLFGTNKKMLNDFLFIKEGKGIFGQKSFDNKAVSEFTYIENNLLDYLGKSDFPELTLNNFARVIKRAKFPSIWYREFRDQNFFKIFLDLCQYAQKSINIFSEDKILRESFLTRKFFNRIKPEEENVFSLKELIFLLSVKFSCGLIDVRGLSDSLTGYLKSGIIKRIEKLVRINNHNKFSVFAFGSFSIGQMGFSSDIDLVFISGRNLQQNDVQKRFQNLLIELRNLLSPFKIDCRLRPEGKSSQLVWEFESYKKYIAERARVWELQAFSKINTIYNYGFEKNDLLPAIVSRLKGLTRKNIKNEILKMRENIFSDSNYFSVNYLNLKKSPGSLNDIEFLIQYFLLCDGNLYQSACGLKTEETLELIYNAGFISNEEKEQLKSNYLFLKKMIISNQIAFDLSSNNIPDNLDTFKALNHFFNFDSGIKLKEKLENTLKVNNLIFKKYLS